MTQGASVLNGPVPVAPVLVARGLVKAFRGRTAVDGLDLHIRPGEAVGLLGPNGAGKTTTVKMLLGLVRPDDGTAELFGRDAADPAARTRVGYLPETFAQPEWATGDRVLRQHARLARVPREDVARAAAAALRRVGLAGRGGGRVGGYSKGMRQRLGLAAALLGDPDLVILDEPTSALDPVGRREVRDIVLALRARGAAVLLNSHLLGEVEQVCDRVVVMDRGRVLADRAVADLPSGGEVRLVLDRVEERLVAVIEGFGTIVHADDRAVLVGLDDRDAGPELVTAVAAAGGRIRAVVPLQSSLEEVFLQLVDHPGEEARS